MSEPGSPDHRRDAQQAQDRWIEPQERWRVGELARVTGLTVRTLHYYDELGLLSPSRTSSGHRVYAAADVERLYRIRLMRGLGLDLDEVGAALAVDGWDPLPATRRHLRAVDERLAQGHRLRERLARTIAQLESADQPDSRDLLATLEEMTMFDTAVRRRIPTLVYDDIAAAHEYLVRVFGFEPGEVSYDEAGHAIHAELTAGDGVIWLHRVAPEWGLASPLTLGVETAGLSIIVDDVDAHHARAVAEGAEIRYPPTDQPYGFREYSPVDLERRAWSFMAPLD
jgi:DNA-binding transcriptional MerR regulator